MTAADPIPAYRFVFLSQSPGKTRALGRRLGEALAVPLVISLVGGLGSGKTMLVQGLARGLGGPDDYYVTSPTYTLINEYPGRLPLVHIDLYRLSGIDDLESIGFFDLISQPAVTAVEWADRVHGWQPPEHLALNLTVREQHHHEIAFFAYGLDAVSLVKRIAQTL